MSTDKAAGSDAVSGATPAYATGGDGREPVRAELRGQLRNIDIFESAEAAGGSDPPAGGGSPPVSGPEPSSGMDVWLIDAGSDRRILKLNDGAVIES